MISHFNKKLLLILLSLLLFITHSFVYAEEKQDHIFTLNSNHAEDSAPGIWLSNVYKELFRRMGIPFKASYFPKKRGSKQVDYGVIDGQFTSVYEYQKFHPNQLRVNVPVIKLSTLAIVRVDSGLHFEKGWDSFNGGQYKIDYHRGILLAEKKLLETVASDNLSNSSSVEQGLLKVKLKRTDVFIHGDIALFHLLKTDKFKDALVSAGVLDTTYLYPYVNIKHKDLVPRMEEGLKEMLHEGIINQYCRDAFGYDSQNFCDSAALTEYVN